ncbi:MAG: hypothetical protein OHK0039_28580 [Bacteroidia bacterium]
MKPIQLLLVPLLLGLLVFFYRRLRQHIVLRFVVSLVLLAVLVFTVFQDSSTWLANRLGIGRGVDLVIYLGLLALAVSCVLLYLRSVRLEQTLTELVRQQALDTAQRPAAQPD